MENELQSSAAKNTVFNFDGTDTQKLFKKNLKDHLFKDWVYKDKTITYRYNEHGFRNKSFTDVDWAKSIVVTGCSNAFGIGLALEDTLCWHLEKMLNTPVVNLAVPASAVDLACWNSLRLHNSYPRPKAIVHCWTSLDRYTDYNDNRLLPFTAHHPQYFGKLNWAYRSMQYIESDRALWKDKIPYVEATFFCMDYDDAQIIKLDFLDKARDFSHPGIKAHYAAAEKISEQLIKQSI